MVKRSHVNTGIRTILEHPSVYNFFQTIIGGNKHRKDHFLKHFGDTKNKKVLDIGSGTAILLSCLENSAEYHGCDMQESYIQFSKEKFKEKGSFYCEKVGETVRKEWLSSFDIVNAHGLLHHLNNEESSQLLDISYKYLKPGGILVTVDSLYHEKQSAMSKWLVSKDRGQNIRTPEGYLKLAKKYFSSVEGFIDDKAFNIPYSVYTMIMRK